jgi:hypothetical protein
MGAILRADFTIGMVARQWVFHFLPYFGLVFTAEQEAGQGQQVFAYWVALAIFYLNSIVY